MASALKGEEGKGWIAGLAFGDLPCETSTALLSELHDAPHTDCTHRTIKMNFNSTNSFAYVMGKSYTCH